MLGGHADPVYFDIFGLAYGDKGRSCDAHSVCGLSLAAGHTVVLRSTLQYNEDTKFTEEVVKVFKVENGLATCHVGYLPRFLLDFKETYVNKLAVVEEVLKDHVNRSCRAHWHHNGGVAICSINNN